MSAYQTWKTETFLILKYTKMHNPNYTRSAESLQWHSKFICFSLGGENIIVYSESENYNYFWWISAHAHILLIAHEVISINNCSCLLQWPHLPHRSNQMNAVTLNNGICRPILKYSDAKQMKFNSAAHYTPIISAVKHVHFSLASYQTSMQAMSF